MEPSPRPTTRPASTTATAARADGAPARAILHRTRGHTGGPITRLMSPGDLGQRLKPFVFLDRFEGDFAAGPPLDTGWHPHSGIATVTVVLDGTARYAESTGASGALPAGSVEWMRAGAGVWHTGSADPGPVRGFQLWVALPPALEHAPSASHYVLPAQVPVAGPARVILGSYQGATSPIAAPPMTYLSVRLGDGERWTFTPPAGHDVGWLAVLDGAVHASARVAAGELALFEQVEAPITLVAEGDTRLVLGAAPHHAHDLHLGAYSVHTSADGLARGEAEIRRIGHTLRAAGKRSYALRALG